MPSIDALKDAVLRANTCLARSGLVTHTRGNVSGIDRDRGLVVIKPSGVPYEELTSDALVVLALSGEQVEGELQASSDAPTHLVLYRAFPSAGGIVHTHSTWATIWAQAERPIPVLGTTHADSFAGEIPCTRSLRSDEIMGDYEDETGRVIVETFADRDPSSVPAVLVRRHGPFTWGADVPSALRNAQFLEEVAELAWRTLALAPETPPLAGALLDRHYQRKHGPNAYYGQKRQAQAPRE